MIDMNYFYIKSLVFFNNATRQYAIMLTPDGVT